MGKFKVGDRVRVKSDYCTVNGKVKGKVGTIKGFIPDNYCNVEFDEFVDGHDCNGLAKKCFGWNVREDDIFLAKSATETIAIYRNDDKVIALDKSTGKKAEAKCSPEDEFDFHVGAKLAFQRLMGDSTMFNGTVREVKRHAKVGEYIKIVNPCCVPVGENNEPYYKKGDIFKVAELAIIGCPRIAYGCDKKGTSYVVSPIEYLALENYKPEEQPEKKDNEIRVGDTVKVVFTGKQYPIYENWSGLEGYKQNFVNESYVNKEAEYKVIRIKTHNRSKYMLALIQNPKTTQVFIISIDGLKKVER